MIAFSDKERDTLRLLAEKWMQAASSEEMENRRQGWKDVKDLKPGRPMIHLESCSIIDFVRKDELLCQNEYLANVEMLFRLKMRQYQMIPDDMVLEPYFRLAYQVEKPDYGLSVEEVHSEDRLAFTYKSPIQTPDDIEKLRPRTFRVKREPVLELKDTLEAIFGDIMPVHLGGLELLTPDQVGYNPLVGIHHIGIPGDVFRLIGHENMLFWTYDEPDALKALCDYLRRDRHSFYDFLEKEGILTANANGWNASASSYGYCSDLPAEKDQNVTTKDLWTWGEAQETSTISPEMLEEFYLPYIGDVAKRFGLSYYGCCEPIQDRMDSIRRAIPNLRAVSVSCWNDMEKAAEAIGKESVFSRKPNPALISGKTPLWDEAKADIQRTMRAAGELPLEFIIRDVYDINGDLERLRKFVLMIREECCRKG